MSFTPSAVPVSDHLVPLAELPRRAEGEARRARRHLLIAVAVLVGATAITALGWWLAPSVGGYFLIPSGALFVTFQQCGAAQAARRRARFLRHWQPAEAGDGGTGTPAGFVEARELEAALHAGSQRVEHGGLSRWALFAAIALLLLTMYATTL